MSTEEHFNLLHDPKFVEWAEHKRAHLLPMIQDSAMTISLVPEGPADIKFAVELGLSVMLNKPVITVVRPGTKLPPKLALIADAVVEWEPGMSHEALMAAIEKIRDTLPDD